MYFAYQYHVVKADEGLLLVPKPQSSTSDWYVDVRNWSAAEWKQHPLLIHSLVKHGRGDLVIGPASNDLLRSFLKPFGSAELDDPGVRTE